MTSAMVDQTLVFLTIGIALLLFALGKPRHDIVAILVLTFLVLAGLIPGDSSFSGFANPAVISVAAILIVSEGLRKSGFVDYASRFILRMPGGLGTQIFVLSCLVCFFSAFMNNIGALAMFMPVAIHVAGKRGFSPSAILMPLAFASLLGGMITLIGTPPNMIISAYRSTATGAPFGLFAFAPVGIGVALAGLLFVALLGWRILPKRDGESSRQHRFNITAYITEVKVGDGSTLIGKTVADIGRFVGLDIQVLGHIVPQPHKASVSPVRQLLNKLLSGGGGLSRGLGRAVKPLQTAMDRRQALNAPPPDAIVRRGDILVIETDSTDIKEFVQKSRTVLLGGTQEGESRGPVDSGITLDDRERIAEVVVLPDSALANKTAAELRLRALYGVSLLAVARQNRKELKRVSKTVLRPGDVLLFRGRSDMLDERITAMGCLPLADRELQLEIPKKMLPAIFIFLTSVLLVISGILPVQNAFALAAVAMVLSGILPIREMYSSVDWSVIVLLGAMLPLGMALESSGAGATLATLVLKVGVSLPPWLIMALIMLVTMLVSAVINNAATVVLMAPVGISIARGLGVSVDPFLMAIAIGASSSFLTPIAHQSNTLVMGPGGYVFGDYVRLGLPMSLICLSVAVPLLLYFWPL